MNKLVRPNFRQIYGTVSEPGSWRSQVRLAAKQAGMLRQLVNGGKKSGVIAAAVEMLYCVLQGNPVQIDECAGMLASTMELDRGAVKALAGWAERTRLLADALDRQGEEMIEAILETE